MRIDAHHHLWTLSRGDYGWMSPDLGPIYRDFAPADLAPLLKEAGIDKTILVQAADTVAETDFMLSLADDTPFIAGVVGWVDMAAPYAIATLDRLARNPHFKGIRPMIQEIADDEWMLRPELDRAFDALVAMELSFDALVLPRHLPHLLRRLDRHPDLACVIDHAAKPALATGDLAQWGRDMARLARDTGAFCKLSGLVTEIGPDWALSQLAPASELVLAEFGAGRVMFGSDWPVLNLASDYRTWVATADTLVASLPEDQRALVWGRTAAAFYRVADAAP
ncbi:amidohydrolase family protein [Pseudaestuariivita atlantica]|uniref:Amidohydrolase n=1 Tax=Pseudaestuariivita atlantica TaxID=1317121 RepID=A0A0L1JLQ1_9RHOB|nr:amidohydrolase family protein [Pseudaestuariivita atlantica]KNG92680.1 amidohydrolase [Pseudaestuariivita atlantica]